MEQQKLAIKTARRYMNRTGLELLIYYGIMNVAVTMLMVVDVCVYLLKMLVKDLPIRYDDVLGIVQESATTNGWGYLLAIAIGTLVVVLWKRRGFVLKEMFVREKKMTFPVFVLLLCVFMLPQMAVSTYSTVLEWILNKLGLSAMAALEMATIDTSSFSMFLYASFLGPIAEELLFRGVVLRQLRPWGKQTAILVSAIAFGLFHGNVIQIPFAFMVGLVLGYVTVEYSIFWAIVLHVFNNFVLSDLIGRLSEISPEGGSVLLMLILVPASVVAIVQLIVKRKQLGEYLRQNKMGKISWRGLLASPFMWIYTGLMFISCLLTITRI